MKKHGNRSNVLKLKQRARRSKTVNKKVANRQRDSLLKKLTKEFFTGFDPSPKVGWVPSSQVYQDFLFFACDHITDCSATKFGSLAVPYVRKKKLAGGRMHYRLTEDCLMRIICHCDKVEGSIKHEIAA